MTPTEQNRPAGLGAGRSGNREAANLEAARGLGLDAADRLVQVATAPGQSILDLDADPALQQAAARLGRAYERASIAVQDQPPTDRVRSANLIVARWPRPGDHSWLASAPATFVAIRALLAPRGQVALVLEPTSAQLFTVTWTRALLDAASTAGLTILQDVICLHIPAGIDDPAHGGQQRTAVHRVVLVLAVPGGRHARD